MAYRELYEFVQALEAPVSRNQLRDKVVSIAKIPKLTHIRTGMDLGVARGLWLTPTNTNHHLVQQCGGHVVLTARGLNKCWERFILVKELMHVFDEENERTGSREDFDGLLNEFASQEPPERSAQMTSEIMAMWRALALFCPEKLRADFESERNAVTIDDYEIALRLRIPQQHVAPLFRPGYSRVIDLLLSK